jgi:hypothetical protein
LSNGAQRYKGKEKRMSIRVLNIDTGELIDAIGAWREDYKSFNTLENLGRGHDLLDTIPGIRLAKITFDHTSEEWYEVWELPDGFTIFD